MLDIIRKSNQLLGNTHVIITLQSRREHYIYSNLSSIFDGTR